MEDSVGELVELQPEPGLVCQLDWSLVLEGAGLDRLVGGRARLWGSLAVVERQARGRNSRCNNRDSRGYSLAPDCSR